MDTGFYTHGTKLYYVGKKGGTYEAAAGDDGVYKFDKVKSLPAGAQAVPPSMHAPPAKSPDDDAPPPIQIVHDHIE